MGTSWTVRAVSSSTELSKAFFVRSVVFIEELGIPYDEEFDGEDVSALHFLGEIAGEPVATARVRFTRGGPVIERLGVRKTYRGKGLGDKLLTFILATLKERDFPSSRLFVEPSYVRWFRNHGFELTGEVARRGKLERVEMVRGGDMAENLSSARRSPGTPSKMPAASDTQPGTAPQRAGRREVVCEISGSTFEITDEDLRYYEKMGVPSPRLCPEERARRRMAFANQRNLFIRQCAGSGKRIITNYPPESKAPVYDLEYWYSDKWDRYQTGRDFNFSRPFFEQFRELEASAPRPNLQRAYALDENADYTNYAGENKDCYLIFDSDKCRDCYYSYSINSSQDVVDCFRAEKCELCYECVDCTNCYRSIFLQNCDNCSESAFLKNCIGCTSCFGSVNLRNKSYYFMNEQCTKSDYQARLKRLKLSHYAQLAQLETQFQEYVKQFPHKNLEGVHNENVIGDYLTNCKNALYCFDSRNLWDCKYIIQAFDDTKDSMDCVEVGYGAELLYECCYVGYTAHFNRFTTHGLGNSSYLTYCYYCPSCSNCFGCIGLHHAEYCILNKPYSASEYQQLVTKIVEHMKQTGEWGEFFPPEVTPFPYNLTHAHEFYPLTKAEAIQRGYCWHEEEEREYQPSTFVVPETITEVADDVLQATLACEATRKNYRIQKSELGFYRKMELPLPRLCPDERHFRRRRKRNGRVLYSRRCEGSNQEILSTIPPGSPIQVYCEEEFLQRLE